MHISDTYEGLLLLHNGSKQEAIRDMQAIRDEMLSNYKKLAKKIDAFVEKTCIDDIEKCPICFEPLMVSNVGRETVEYQGQDVDLIENELTCSNLSCDWKPKYQ